MPDPRLPLRLAALAVGLFVYLTCELFPVGAQAELATGLGVPASQVGLLLTAYAIAAGVLTLPAVRMMSRFPARFVLAGTMLLLAIAQVGFATADTLTAAVLWRALAAVGHGLLWSQAPVVAVRMTPAAAGGRATSTVLLGASAGLLLGSPLVAALSHAVGWRSTSVALAAAALATAALLMWLLPQDSGLTRERRRPEAPRWRPILTVCVLTVILVVGHYVSYANLEQLAARAGLIGGTFVAALVIYGVAGLVGVRVAGLGLDRMPRETALIMVGLLFIALAALVISGPVSTLVAILLWGGASAALPVVLNTAAIRADPPRSDLASGAYVVAYQIGISAGSALGVLVIDHGTVAALPPTSAGLILLGAVFLVVRSNILARNA